MISSLLLGAAAAQVPTVPLQNARDADDGLQTYAGSFTTDGSTWILSMTSSIVWNVPGGFPLDFPQMNVVAPGESWIFQYWFRDANLQVTSSTSAAVRITFQ